MGRTLERIAILPDSGKELADGSAFPDLRRRLSQWSGLGFLLEEGLHGRRGARLSARTPARAGAFFEICSRSIAAG
jgi:hypothetical protein